MASGSILTDQTSTTNIASRENFSVEIATLPNVSYFATTATIPGVQLGRIKVPTPLSDWSEQGDKVEFDDLSIQFIVDENLENYLEIWRWIMYLGFPRNTDQYADLINENTQYYPKSDIIITCLTNKFNENFRFHFIDCFPLSLGELEFTTENEETTPIPVQATFGYSYYVPKP